MKIKIVVNEKYKKGRRVHSEYTIFSLNLSSILNQLIEIGKVQSNFKALATSFKTLNNIVSVIRNDYFRSSGAYWVQLLCLKSAKIRPIKSHSNPRSH